MCAYQQPVDGVQMLLFVSGTSQKLVHGSLIEAEILTPFPHVFAQCGSDSG